MNQSTAAWLANARASLEPTPQDQSRVQVNLAQVLGSAALGSAPEVSKGSEVAVNPTPSGSALRVWNAGLHRATWLVAGLAIGGVAGYQVGLTRVIPDASISAPPATDLVPTASTTQAKPFDPLTEDPVTVQQIAVKRPQTPTVNTSTARAHSASSQLTGGARQATDDNEVFLLQRVERALRQGNAQLALSLLRELDQAAPQGRLLQERSAARILARCMLSAPGSHNEAERFEQRYPNSVHSSRIEKGCKQ